MPIELRTVEALLAAAQATSQRADLWATLIASTLMPLHSQPELSAHFEALGFGIVA